MKWTLFVKDNDESSNLLYILKQQPNAVLSSVLKEVKIVRYGDAPYIQSKKKKIVGGKKILPILVQRGGTQHKKLAPIKSSDVFDYNSMLHDEMFDGLQEEQEVDNKAQDKEDIARRRNSGIKRID
jgi:hypothetical protein